MRISERMGLARAIEIVAGVATSAACLVSTELRGIFVREFRYPPGVCYSQTRWKQSGYQRAEGFEPVRTGDENDDGNRESGPDALPVTPATPAAPPRRRVVAWPLAPRA